MRDVVIVQADEKYEPPEQPVLKVSVIGSEVFLSIVKYEEDHDTVTMKQVAQVCVGTEELLLALHSSVHADAAGDRRRATRKAKEK